MSAAQLEVVIDIVHVRVALRSGIWQYSLAVSAARRTRPQAGIASRGVVSLTADAKVRVSRPNPGWRA